MSLQTIPFQVPTNGAATFLTPRATHITLANPGGTVFIQLGVGRIPRFEDTKIQVNAGGSYDRDRAFDAVRLTTQPAQPATNGTLEVTVLDDVGAIPVSIEEGR